MMVAGAGGPGFVGLPLPLKTRIRIIVKAITTTAETTPITIKSRRRSRLRNSSRAGRSPEAVELFLLPVGAVSLRAPASSVSGARRSHARRSSVGELVATVISFTACPLDFRRRISAFLTGAGEGAGLLTVAAPVPPPWGRADPPPGGSRGDGGAGGGEFKAERPAEVPDTCQLLRGGGDGMPGDVLGLGVLTLPSDTPGPMAAGQSRGISSAGGGAMGICVHGSRASITSRGV